MQGDHWVTVCITRSDIYYFDPLLYPVPQEVIESLQKCTNINNNKRLLHYNKHKVQEDGIHCGDISCYFANEILNGKSFNDVESNSLSSEMLTAYRTEIFIESNQFDSVIKDLLQDHTRNEEEAKAEFNTMWLKGEHIDEINKISKKKFINKNSKMSVEFKYPCHMKLFKPLNVIEGYKKNSKKPDFIFLPFTIQTKDTSQN